MKKGGAVLGIIIALILWQPRLSAQNQVVAEIPIKLVNNRTIVAANVGPSGPLRLILDTGLAYDGILLFDTAKVDLSQFAGLAVAQIGGAGADKAARALTAPSASFSVGSVKFENQRVTMLTGDAFKRFPTDGVIGYSLLGHYVVEIDYDRNRMVLYEASSFTPDAAWESLNIYFKENTIPWTEIFVATKDEKPVRLSAYVDSASGAAIELLERKNNTFSLPRMLQRRQVGRGLSGDIHGWEGRLSAVTLGSFVLKNVAALVVPAEARSKQEKADAIIGNNALRRFNVIYDYAHLKIHLKPNRYFREPF